MRCPQLRLLEGERDVRALPNSASDDIGLVADDHRDRVRRHGFGGPQHALDHGPPGDRVQHLGQRGPHPRSLAGGQNHDVSFIDASHIMAIHQTICRVTDAEAATLLVIRRILGALDDLVHAPGRKPVLLGNRTYRFTSARPAVFLLNDRNQRRSSESSTLHWLSFRRDHRANHDRELARGIVKGSRKLTGCAAEELLVGLCQLSGRPLSGLLPKIWRRLSDCLGDSMRCLEESQRVLNCSKQS